MCVKLEPIDGHASCPQASDSFQKARQVRALFLRVIERWDDRMMLCQAVLGDESAERAARTDFEEIRGVQPLGAHEHQD